MILPVAIQLSEPLLTHYMDRSRACGSTLEELILQDLAVLYHQHLSLEAERERRSHRDREYERL